MENRIVDQEIVLIPYSPNYELTLRWYQDPELCKQVDNIDLVYPLDRQSQAMFRSDFNRPRVIGMCFRSNHKKQGSTPKCFLV